MRIIVCDSSCLIDLRKASLLDAFISLPYEILIPDTLFEEELLKFTPAQKRLLLNGGLKVVDVPGDGVLRAQAIARDLPQLSIHDALGFALAEFNPGCILLTGDGGLRKLAAGNGMEVHGVLWIVDEIHRHRLSAASALYEALQALVDDNLIRLPHRELTAYIKKYEKLR